MRRQPQTLTGMQTVAPGEMTGGGLRGCKWLWATKRRICCCVGGVHCKLGKEPLNPSHNRDYDRDRSRKYGGRHAPARTSGKHLRLGRTVHSTSRATGPVDVTAVTGEATVAMTVPSQKSCRVVRWLCKVLLESQNRADVTAGP